MTAPSCTDCNATEIRVAGCLAAVRAKLDDYVDAPRDVVLRHEAAVHNRMRELKVAVRARLAHREQHIAAAHRKDT